MRILITTIIAFVTLMIAPEKREVLSLEVSAPKRTRTEDKETLEILGLESTGSDRIFTQYDRSVVPNHNVLALTFGPASCDDLCNPNPNPFDLVLYVANDSNMAPFMIEDRNLNPQQMPDLKSLYSFLLRDRSELLLNQVVLLADRRAVSFFSDSNAMFSISLELEHQNLPEVSFRHFIENYLPHIYKEAMEILNAHSKRAEEKGFSPKAAFDKFVTDLVDNFLDTADRGGLSSRSIRKLMEQETQESREQKILKSLGGSTFPCKTLPHGTFVVDCPEAMALHKRMAQGVSRACRISRR